MMRIVEFVLIEVRTFFCNNGYLQWPEAICPYSGEPCHTLKGYFSTNLKSVRKDVKCAFGIFKKGGTF
jgi:hypothetical protein